IFANPSLSGPESSILITFAGCIMATLAHFPVQSGGKVFLNPHSFPQAHHKSASGASCNRYGNLSAYIWFLLLSMNLSWLVHAWPITHLRGTIPLNSHACLYNTDVPVVVIKGPVVTMVQALLQFPSNTPTSSPPSCLSVMSKHSYLKCSSTV